VDPVLIAWGKGEFSSNYIRKSESSSNYGGWVGGGYSSNYMGEVWVQF